MSCLHSCFRWCVVCGRIGLGVSRWLLQPTTSALVSTHQHMHTCTRILQHHALLGSHFALPLCIVQAFALFTARHQIALCHYDIKLLNFLVQNVRIEDLQDSALAPDAPGEDDLKGATQGSGDGGSSSTLGFSYALGGSTFQLQPSSSVKRKAASPPTCRVVKLADFGTSFFDGARAPWDAADPEEVKIGAMDRLSAWCRLHVLFWRCLVDALDGLACVRGDAVRGQGL
jgi:hypothetical protein